MTTARQTIEGALKLLVVTPAEGSISSVEIQDGLTSLNDMLTEWALEGTQVGFDTIDDADDTLYVEDGVIGAIKANLAIYMAPEYDRIVTPALLARARRGKTVIRANVPTCPVEFPDTLPVGVGNENRLSTKDGDKGGTGYGNRFYPGNRDRCN